MKKSYILFGQDENVFIFNVNEEEEERFKLNNFFEGEIRSLKEGEILGYIVGIYRDIPEEESSSYVEEYYGFFEEFQHRLGELFESYDLYEDEKIYDIETFVRTIDGESIPVYL